MRLLFIPSNGRHTGDLLEIYLCQECGIPKQFKDNFCMICTCRYPRAELGTPTECFMCAKHFDGNTPATEVIIELTTIKKDQTDDRNTDI